VLAVPLWCASRKMVQALFSRHCFFISPLKPAGREKAENQLQLLVRQPSTWRGLPGEEHRRLSGLAGHIILL
jgi:hypothetical protein